MCRVCAGPNVAKITETEFWPNILVPAKEQVVNQVDDCGYQCTRPASSSMWVRDIRLVYVVTYALCSYSRV
jgi:hypothetical protein